MKYLMYKQTNKTFTSNILVVFLVSMLVFNLFVFALKGSNQIISSTTAILHLNATSSQHESQLKKLPCIEQKNETSFCENEEDEDDKETILKSKHCLNNTLSFSIFQVIEIKHFVVTYFLNLYRSCPTKIYLFLQVFRL